MNIALFTDTYYPEINGVATSVLTLKTELENFGHHVYVFTTTTPGAPEYEHNVFRVASLPFMLMTERRIGLFYTPKLAGVIKKLNLDLIHTHTEFSLGIFGRIMARELQLPLVHTYHTIYEDYTHYVAKLKGLDKGAKAFVRGYTKYCCNTVQRVIAPTEKVKDLLINYSVHRDIEVVPTGIDLKKFREDTVSKEEILALKEKYNIGEEKKVILYIGRIAPEKNIEEILAAMPEYMEKHEDVCFVIVGNGTHKEKLEKYVSDFRCKDRIIFTGEQPWDFIAKFYHMGDVFVSASNSETQGLTYMEAMASGLPVVAKKDPCLDGILIDGYNGYQFIDAQGLRDGLDAVLYHMFNTDAKKAEETNIAYVENSIAMAQRFSIQEFAKNVEKVYKDVINDLGN